MSSAPTVPLRRILIGRGDETYDKFGFYFAGGVDELLVVHPSSREVEWYERGERAFDRSGASGLPNLTEAQLSAEIDRPRDA